jgi:hypothetical protein
MSKSTSHNDLCFVTPKNKSFLSSKIHSNKSTKVVEGHVFDEKWSTILRILKK